MLHTDLRYPWRIRHGLIEAHVCIALCIGCGWGYPWRIRHGLIEARRRAARRGTLDQVIRGEFATASLKPRPRGARGDGQGELSVANSPRPH